MKKTAILLTFIILVVNSFSTYAQRSRHQDRPPRLSAGILAGINIAGQSTPDATDLKTDKIMRFNGGVYASYFLLNSLAIQPEITISGKGVHWNDQFSDGKDLLTYLDIPVMIKFQPVKMFNFQVGPDFGFRLKAAQKTAESSEQKDIKDSYTSTDLGLAFGMEVNLPYKLNLTVRYIAGIKPVTTDYPEPWKNNFFQITVGYRLADLLK